MYDKNANYAILLKDGIIRSCSMREFFRSRGRRVRVQHDVVRNYSVETEFTGESQVLDGPQLWWSTIVTKRATPRAGGPIVPSSIEELFASAHSATFTQSFATKEEALAQHMGALKLIRRDVRRKSEVADSEMLSETLLSHLDHWCKAERGRQAEMARALDVTPQQVNHWLTGRKQMTGEQALRLLWHMVRVQRNLLPLRHLFGKGILWSDLNRRAAR
jgi:predicted XRE-type DNA-binding protein